MGLSLLQYNLILTNDIGNDLSLIQFTFCATGVSSSANEFWGMQFNPY